MVRPTQGFELCIVPAKYLQIHMENTLNTDIYVWKFDITYYKFQVILGILKAKPAK